MWGAAPENVHDKVGDTLKYESDAPLFGLLSQMSPPFSTTFASVAPLFDDFFKCRSPNREHFQRVTLPIDTFPSYPYWLGWLVITILGAWVWQLHCSYNIADS